MGQETKGYHIFCCCCSDDSLLLSGCLSMPLLCLCWARCGRSNLSTDLPHLGPNVDGFEDYSSEIYRWPQGQESVHIHWSTWNLSYLHDTQVPLTCHLICRRWGFHRDHPSSAGRMRVINACDWLKDKHKIHRFKRNGMIDERSMVWMV